ncbi:MBL fold metallo-hydrolase [Marinobacterium sedimentorum]|uniref:MBL fold metallo-hydrolase n=1 Tax=Marinobacterium sedimentorum TaxID=2927804 RepID=UPI0020C6DCC4|nr:MBL fold metallo-hydrolase [Marinobacterium sedimentorum]MCP8687577.1 MBL fold metallo-hydrolase [Marinobacterium sedimentorum]
MITLRTQFAALLLSILAALSFLAPAAMAQTDVVILGTGTPVPDADRSGPSTAVIYNDQAYVFDAGGGMVQRAIEAAQKKGIKALYPTSIKHLFLTHLHSDHVLDYPELAATYWWRRTEQLTAYGPTGLKAMTDGYYAMLARDIELRTDGHQPVENPTFYQVKVNEYSEGGWIVQDGDVRIEAFSVLHGSIEPAFGYKITTPDKVVVISGDTAYSENLAEIAKGADVLVHEVINEAGLSKLPEFWQRYHGSSHTKTSELAKLASVAQPGVLVLTHILHYGAPIESTLTEVQQGYDGKVVLANDLDVF